jgi:hypothetical protein
MSSVGYGYISPQTWEGQLVCICYSIIGIPLFLLTLTNLSGNFGNIFSYLYIKFNSINPITKYLNERRKKRRIERKKLKKRRKSSSTLKSSINNTIHDASINQSELDHALFVLSDLSPSYELELSDEDNDNDDDSDENDDDDEYDKKSIIIIIIIVATIVNIIIIINR